MLEIMPYNRSAALEYAHKWAYSRNPDFYDFKDIGGDCTNFASQCLLAGTGVMNYTPTFGWYYRSANDRTPSWTGVPYLYNFLTANTGLGPFATETSIANMEPGDLVQLSISSNPYHHTPVIVEIRGNEPSLRNIMIAAHSNDADLRPLSSFPIRKIRFLHIEGYRIDSAKINRQNSGAIPQGEDSAVREPFLQITDPWTEV